MYHSTPGSRVIKKKSSSGAGGVWGVGLKAFLRTTNSLPPASSSLFGGHDLVYDLESCGDGCGDGSRILRVEGVNSRVWVSGSRIQGSSFLEEHQLLAPRLLFAV